MVYFFDLLFQATDAQRVTALLHTSHVLAVSSSSLNLQTIEISAAHIMVDLTYYCTALTTTVSIAVRIKRYRHVLSLILSHTCETIV